MKRRICALLAMLALLGAAAPPSNSITITINGEVLPLQPPPRFITGHLFVPVRRTIEALGLDFNRDGKRIWTHAGARLAVLSLGSMQAQLDGRDVALGAAPLEINNVLYAPLTFFTGVLGAQASYDPHHNAVTIVATEMGRSGAGVTVNATHIERIGTVSAVDLNSDPPTITLTYNAAVKTIPIARNSLVDMRDVVANVSRPGELGDIRAGDFARVTMQKNGHVERVEDAYGSFQGTIAAVIPGEFVLDDGHVVTPGRTTVLSLNAAPVQLSDLRAGDRAVVRYNVETDEIREVLATRGVAAAPASSTLRIAAISLPSNGVFRAGDTVRIAVQGTPHAAATFDIGAYVSELAMSESTPGTYRASYTIPNGANFSDAPVVAHLRSAGASVSAASDETISAASTPPSVVDVAPANQSVVNSRRPAIYATFAPGAVPINPSSVTLRVNGHDVTASCVRNEHFIHYTPMSDYGRGPVNVVVSVADRAGNALTKQWTFTVNYR